MRTIKATGIGVLSLLCIYALYLGWNYLWMYLGWQGVSGVSILFIIQMMIARRLKPQYKG